MVVYYDFFEIRDHSGSRRTLRRVKKMQNPIAAYVATEGFRQLKAMIAQDALEIEIDLAVGTFDPFLLPAEKNLKVIEAELTQDAKAAQTEEEPGVFADPFMLPTSHETQTD